MERGVFDGVFGAWAGLFPREGNKIPLSPSLPLPYRTAAGRIKEFLHALARADGGGASTGTPCFMVGFPGRARQPTPPERNAQPGAGVRREIPAESRSGSQIAVAFPCAFW